MISALEVYAMALADGARPLLARGARGRVRPVGLARWMGPVDEVDERVLARAHGPVLDVGCGPGRHVRALARRGVLAVGVDVSPAAIMLARRHGAVALQGSVFEHVPGGGRWRTALLLDGNIGIGASPAALLRRVASLLAPRGEVLVELAAPGCGIVVHPLRLEHGDARSAWFAWAEVGVDAIAGPAAAGRLAVGDSWCDGGRWFALLERR